MSLTQTQYDALKPGDELEIVTLEHGRERAFVVKAPEGDGNAMIRFDRGGESQPWPSICCGKTTLIVGNKVKTGWINSLRALPEAYAANMRSRGMDAAKLAVAMPKVQQHVDAAIAVVESKVNAVAWTETAPKCDHAEDREALMISLQRGKLVDYIHKMLDGRA
jgi:hypothetical protein